MPITWPLTFVIPPDKARKPGLALPNGQWRWLADGSMEVTYQDADEMRLCLDATKACGENKEVVNDEDD